MQSSSRTMCSELELSYGRDQRTGHYPPRPVALRFPGSRSRACFQPARDQGQGSVPVQRGLLQEPPAGLVSSLDFPTCSLWPRAIRGSSPGHWASLGISFARWIRVLNRVLRTSRPLRVTCPPPFNPSTCATTVAVCHLQVHTNTCSFT